MFIYHFFTKKNLCKINIFIFYMYNKQTLIKYITGTLMQPPPTNLQFFDNYQKFK